MDMKTSQFSASLDNWGGHSGGFDPGGGDGGSGGGGGGGGGGGSGHVHGPSS
ncbi:hypothetical protein RvY_18490 [Ramazzottius varieornatus]|uniref:Uncharacterized protein n=1 Tax=Ramazzottius varieornatus TaxID=947166 RepID=A0A1D1WBB1_RAMVA|nr:hypothetical protein RvY_18490 [Ramazzottius varieornatus]